MLTYLWPIALVLLSNTVYQVCAKGVPDKVSPYAALTVTYLVGAVFSALLHVLLYPGSSLLREFSRMNWAPFVLGLVIVGLEVGWIYAYRAGWPVSVGNLVASALLAIVLIFVGALFYKEALTWNRLVGIAICLIGLVFINLK